MTLLAKRIVAQAQAESKSIAMENLTGIRQRTKQRGPVQRRRHSSWAFFQLKSFVAYKAQLARIRLVEVNPAYTSKTCSCCGVIGKRNGKHFQCANSNCSVELDADINGAKNIARLGSLVIRPEASLPFACAWEGRCEAPRL